MNKQDLINIVSADTGLSKADAKRAVEAVFDNIKTALSEADTAQFVGFGTFRVEYREARQAGWLCDGSRIRRELGFTPCMSLVAGMAEAVEGYRREGWL